MLHVGMNISDKIALCQEIWRVLKPGAVFGIYDIMKISDEPLALPVPWATAPEGSALASPDEYKRALAAADGPPPIGLHVILGANASTKIQNMVSNIAKGNIAPIELIVRKA